MSNTTDLNLVNFTTTPAPGKKPFCLDCGFDFGHIADGIEDKTMGIILVVIVMVVAIGITMISCYCYYNHGQKYNQIDSDA